MTDREAITDAIYRYCRAMDRIDPELGRSVWHPDGTADYGPGRFSGNGREIVDRVCLIHAKLLTIRIRSPTSSSNSTVTGPPVNRAASPR